jgi:hypothetical protein
MEKGAKEGGQPTSSPAAAPSCRASSLARLGRLPFPSMPFFLPHSCSATASPGLKPVALAACRLQSLSMEPPPDLDPWSTAWRSEMVRLYTKLGHSLREMVFVKEGSAHVLPFSKVSISHWTCMQHASTC